MAGSNKQANARLAGKRLLVTRARNQASALVRAIEDLGGEAIEFPVIKIQATTDVEKLAILDQAIRVMDQWDRVIFTSVNGVEVFLKRLAEMDIARHSLNGIVIDTVGPKTAKALTDAGLVVEPIPLVYQAEGLLETLLPKLKDRESILIFRSELARDYLPNQLTELGHEVELVDAYETVICDEGAEEVIALLEQQHIDIITFTSSSTVHNLMKIIRQHDGDPIRLLAETDIACIGPITAQTLESYGLSVTFLAKEATIESLVDIIS